MKFRLVAAERASFPVRALCRVVGASASGFYAWLRRGPAPGRGVDQALRARVGAIFAASRGTYGSPRVHAELRAQGMRVGRSRVAVERCAIDHARGRAGGHAPPAGPAHDRQPARPRGRAEPARAALHGRPARCRLAGRHLLRADRGGWLYLAAVKDMATREIVGWSMADSLRAGLACDALLMAIRRRQPPRGLIPHSDRGVQYASEPYQAVLARHGLRCSMSRRGNCLDNAPMESFFGTLKTELVHRTAFPTRAAARRAIFGYVETL